MEVKRSEQFPVLSYYKIPLFRVPRTVRGSPRSDQSFNPVEFFCQKTFLYENYRIFVQKSQQYNSCILTNVFFIFFRTSFLIPYEVNLPDPILLGFVTVSLCRPDRYNKSSHSWEQVSESDSNLQLFWLTAHQAYGTPGQTNLTSELRIFKYLKI